MALAVVTAIGSGQEPRGQSGSGHRYSTAGRNGAIRPVDSKSFINDLAIAGMAEVQLGTLAAKRAANADHSKGNNELKQIAAQLNVQPPTQLDEQHRDLAERLSQLKGAEFDRKYADAMVKYLQRARDL